MFGNGVSDFLSFQVRELQEKVEKAGGEKLEKQKSKVNKIKAVSKSLLLNLRF